MGFIDRPIEATEMLPATFSNVGFGLYGKLYKKNWVYAYETYLTNGFDDRIITNSQNKTFLPASKLNPNRFEESSNGQPLLTTKVAIKNRKIGELGISYTGGVYNKFQEDGIVLDKKRMVNVWAVDFNTILPVTRTYITTEWAVVNVDVPETYTQQYGRRQAGGFVDFVQPFLKRNVFGFNRSVVNAVFRFEYVDWNIGKFVESGTSIHDDVVSISPGLSWRPFAQTVIRLNYRYKWQTDIFGNPASRSGGFQFGFSSYF